MVTSSRSGHSLTTSRAVSSCERVHPHVERRVGRVREAALRPVELHGRDAEVEQDRVGAHAVGGELRKNDAEVAAQQSRLHARVLLEALEVGARGRVAVDRDQLAAPLQVGCEQAAVAARAEGRVDDRLARLHGEARAHLGREDGDVISRAGLQDVRQHALHSLRPRRAPAARRRDPRSRGGRGRPRRRRRGRASRAPSVPPGCRPGPACRARLRWRPSRSSAAAGGPPC